SLVPGLAKQVETPPSIRVSTSASAPESVGEFLEVMASSVNLACPVLDGNGAEPVSIGSSIVHDPGQLRSPVIDDHVGTGAAQAGDQFHRALQFVQARPLGAEVDRRIVTADAVGRDGYLVALRRLLHQIHVWD